MKLLIIQRCFLKFYGTNTSNSPFFSLRKRDCVKSQQAEVIRILESKSIQYELIDISVGGELRDEMRSKVGDPTAVPPQLFNEHEYCGSPLMATLGGSLIFKTSAESPH
uniref:SH3 domain-binding glutamic acid-rich-like protein 3 n=1 Tax=Oreochromis niloticus TaxID=8128 RepID=A0A669EHC2_ORENI